MSDPIQVPMPGAALSALMKKGGKEEDVSVDPYKVSERKYGRPFDAAIAEARQNGSAPPLTEQAMGPVM